MKILVVVPYFEEKHRWMISGQKAARELSKNNKVVVLTTGQKDIKIVESPNMTIYRIKDIFLKDPINYSFVPGLWRKTKAIALKEKPDSVLINKNMFYPNLAIWPLKRLGYNVVVQVDTFPGINWHPKSKLVGIVMWFYARIIGNPILWAAKKVVLLHEGLVPVAKKYHFNHEVIHNGIDIEEFNKTKPPSDLKKRPGEIWVGYVGRLESVKGWYDLATAGMELVEKFPKVHFMFIGPKEKAEEQIKQFKHPHIHFISSRSDVAGIDKLLDIFVMPSLSEGLSNAIMEAMTAKAACVVSNVGGNIVLIQHNRNGLHFSPGDIKDLKKQLTKLIVDKPLRERLGDQAAKDIDASYSLRKETLKLEKLLWQNSIKK